MNEERKHALVELLKPLGQEHLVAFWDRLDSLQREKLEQQIRNVDFQALARLRGGPASGPNWQELAARAKSPPAFRLDKRANRFTPEQATQRGAQALAAGQVAALLVAGGQGTRLGFDHPKGLFPIGPVSQATLFQILFEMVVAVGRRYGVTIPLYLMTSPATHEETVEFLESHDRFGIKPYDLHIFCQGTMPAVDAKSGKVLLADYGELATSPDGHGGMLAALAASGGLDDLAQRGIRQIFYFQVDNPLTPICDAEFLGYHVLSKSELSTLVIAKQEPEEKVGNVASIDGRVQIIEYSDLSDDAARRRTEDGSLELWAGNTAIHVIDVAFLSRVKGDEAALPFHLAHKKVPYIDASGKSIDPVEPNATKFERFIFDLLPAAEHAIVVEADPAEAFAPVKNGPGARRDSPESVRRQMVALYRGWLREANVYVAEGVDVEISPLFALDAAETAKKAGKLGPITKPTWLRPSRDR